MKNEDLWWCLMRIVLYCNSQILPNCFSFEYLSKQFGLQWATHRILMQCRDSTGSVLHAKPAEQSCSMIATIVLIRPVLKQASHQDPHSSFIPSHLTPPAKLKIANWSSTPFTTRSIDWLRQKVRVHMEHQMPLKYQFMTCSNVFLQ